MARVSLSNNKEVKISGTKRMLWSGLENLFNKFEFYPPI